MTDIDVTVEDAQPIEVTLEDTQSIDVTVEDAQPINIIIEGYLAVENHNTLAGLQGGKTAQYYHLTEDDYTELTEWLDNVTLGSNGATQIPQLILTPSEAAIEAIEGGIFYNGADKSIYVCTEAS